MDDIRLAASQNGGIDVTVVYISTARTVSGSNQLRFTIDFTSRDSSWSLGQKELVSHYLFHIYYFSNFIISFL